jgi:hypothetical protein
MGNNNTQTLFPGFAMQYMRGLRSKRRDDLIDNAIAAAPISRETIGFVHLMTTECGSSICKSDSFRAIKAVSNVPAM